MNEQIEELESQLAQMSTSKRWMVYSVIVLASLYMSFVLYSEELFDEVQLNEDKILSLESKLMKNSNRSLERAILKSKKNILVLEDEINNLHFKKQFIQTKLQSIDFVYYDEMGSAQILDDILRNSILQHINLEFIQKIPIDKQEKSLIQQKSHIIINGEGSLGAITSLQHYIENLNALLSSESLHVEIDDDNATHFELRLIHYGVEL